MISTQATQHPTNVQLFVSIVLAIWLALGMIIHITQLGTNTEEGKR